MIGYTPAIILIVSVLVFTVHGADVYLIDASSKNGNVHRLKLSADKKSLVLDLPPKEDSTDLFGDNNVFEIHKLPDNRVKQLSKQNRVFGNMFGNPANFKTYFIKKVPSYENHRQLDNLEPIIKYLLSHKSAPNKFEDLTRNEKPPFSEDYVDFGELGRVQTEPDFSQDYIDFRSLRQLPKLRLRRATNVKKQALRSYQDSDEDDDDDDDLKSKRFEVVKNKYNKKDIQKESEETDEEEASDSDSFKETKDRNEDKNEELDSDEEFSELSDKDDAPKKITRQSKKKKKESLDEEEKDGDEEVELYLQGNKLTIFPPVAPDSSEETRRNNNRRMRMPYFMPKRYHWSEKDIPNLGYFFFNGPKGVSEHSD